jgi:deoxyguanosine kinase
MQNINKQYVARFIEAVRKSFGLHEGETLRVAVSGNIGVGKTTFLENFKDVSNVKVHQENFAENPYLEKYYQDQSRLAFQTQMWFLAQRLENANSVSKEQGLSAVFFDRHLIEDQVFANANHNIQDITDIDMKTYTLLFDNIMKTVDMPHLVILLKANPKLCSDRILTRSREIENNAIPLSYLEELDKCYTQFRKKIKKQTTVIELDWTTFQDVEVSFDLILHQLRYKEFDRKHVVANESREF